MKITDLQRRVNDIIDVEFDNQLQFLKELVRQPSYLGNPDGERAAQELCKYVFHEMGLEVTPVVADHGQLSRLPGYSPVEWSFRNRPLGMVGVWKSPHRGGRSLVLNGHVDVVPVSPVLQWERDPWNPTVVGKRMYGRGACDMKAGVSAMIYAVRALKMAGVELKGDVILQTVLEEECTGNGTLACLARGFVGDGCLIPEPFGQTILTAQVGVLWMRVDVYGSAGHTRDAHAMVNAIEKAYELIAALRRLEEQWNKERHPAFRDHPHPINFNPGLIQGGNWPSSVPAHCEFTIRLSFYPGEDPEEIKQRVRSYLDEIIAKDPWFKKFPPEVSWYGHHDWGVYEPHPENNPLIQTVVRAHERVTGKPAQYCASTAVTDVRFWTEHWGKPATCYGPHGGNLHAPNEWVCLDSLREVTKVIAAVIMDWCGTKEV